MLSKSLGKPLDTWIKDFKVVTRVGNICFFSPLVLSNERILSFLSFILFEESVFIFQFLNDKMHRKQNMTVNFIIQKLKINKFSSKIYKLRKLRNLSGKELYALFDIVVPFIIQTLKKKHIFLKKYTDWKS